MQQLLATAPEDLALLDGRDIRKVHRGLDRGRIGVKRQRSETLRGDSAQYPASGREGPMSGVSEPSHEGNPSRESGPHRIAAGRAAEALRVLDEAERWLDQLGHIREATAELVLENRRLHQDNVRLSRALVDQSNKEQTLGTSAKTEQLDAERRHWQEQAANLGEESRKHQQDLTQLNDLLSTTATLHQSHDREDLSVALAKLLRQVDSIEAFAVLERDEDDIWGVLAEHRLDDRLPTTGVVPDGLLLQAIETKVASLHASHGPTPDEIVAAIPLIEGEACTGVIVIFEPEQPDTRLTTDELDRLLSIAHHAAAALARGRDHRKVLRKLKTLEAMLDMLASEET